MFVWECIKSEGTHVGVCVDTFMFGSCCVHNSTVNSIGMSQETNSSALQTKPSILQAVADSESISRTTPRRTTSSTTTSTTSTTTTTTTTLRPSLRPSIQDGADTVSTSHNAHLQTGSQGPYFNYL